ncbi:DNA repair protein RAD51 homolog 3 isoform X3 [Octopus bimaculoides]|uniref:DNA repair protein RAD51 homolog 3 isoform X3 n=1 Tax=Octopus bimaculoides TaxID=37653 RepID=UPI00071C7F40|nr:DNA repair protein RAD51 homolog 3 isoform X3 [Octopus bimaculoides]|eukprot:XP_014786211.1 PREDICTED: DNA repair protein RAD51 homolog 3-like isoform X2 [Octopus bimaculoides]
MTYFNLVFSILAPSPNLEIRHEEAMEILNCIHKNGAPLKTVTSGGNTVSAFDLLLKEQNLQNIVTFSEKLDSMLSGGIPLGKITEFCGAPGIGKTQMCMQLAVDVQIPECFGGVEGEAIYIDTEGSFIVERLQDIAEVTVRHCQNLNTEGDTPVTFTTDQVLNGIHYFRCRDYVELLAIIHLLSELIKDRPKVKLVIIDSIAFHFRHDFEDIRLRTCLLTTIAQSLIQIANKHTLAVVLTNQMTTRINNNSSSSYMNISDTTQNMVPALGESWAHISTIRIILYWKDNQRKALLYKSPEHKEDVVSFQITMGGIRDVVNHDPTGKEPEHGVIAAAEEPATKRQKTV